MALNIFHMLHYYCFILLYSIQQIVILFNVIIIVILLFILPIDIIILSMLIRDSKFGRTIEVGLLCFLHCANGF